MTTALEKKLRPYVLSGIRLEAKRAKVPVGKSKLGGLPDLPEDVDWPSVVRERVEFRLAFLAQIDLADVARLDREKLLPRSGLLSFFTLDLVRAYDAIGPIKKGKTTFVPEGATRAIYVAKGTKLARREAPADLPESYVGDESKVSFSSVLTWPQVEGAVIGGPKKGKVALSDAEWRDWAKNAEKPPALAMLGHPDGIEFPIGSDPKERLLLSLNEKESGLPFELFGRNGHVYFHAPEASIRKGRWDDVVHREW